MKKFLSIMATVIVALGFVSCDNEAEKIAESNKEIKFNISVSSPIGAESRAVKTSWNTGDKIFIWFDGQMYTQPDLTITYNGTTWEAGELWTTAPSRLLASGTMKYFYLSSNTLENLTVTTTQSYNFSFPKSNEDGDVSNNTTSLTLCSHLEGGVAPTYTYTGGVLSLNLNSWKFLTNTQVTVPIPNGTNADDYRLSFSETGNVSNALAGIKLATSYVGKSTSSSSYARGLSATDGAVFHLHASATEWYTTSKVIKFTLVDMSSGSKKVYVYSTNVAKALPLSNGVSIEAITGSGGCVENAFSAIKLPAFTGAADSNWTEQ